MKKLTTFLLTLLGLAPACSGQQQYENADVEAFAQLVSNSGVQLLDVRTPEEYTEGHLEGATNIDVNRPDFAEYAKGRLDTARPVAVYCRSGRRSANAAGLLAAEGFTVTNLKGGIMAWKEKGQRVTTVDAELFMTKGGKQVLVYALMHASVRIVADGKEIEIDPVGQLGERRVDYGALPKADFIFVTHEHRDHFDPDALALLTGEGTTLVTNRRCADMLGRGEVMANGDTLTLMDGKLTVEAVPAYNITEGHTQFHPKGRDNGYVLTFDGLRIYIAGDTEDIPEMAALKDIDVAFMPCNQPYTMTTDQLLRAARTVQPRHLLPYHFSQTDLSGVPAELQGDGIDVRLLNFEF